MMETDTFRMILRFIPVWLKAAKIWSVEQLIPIIDTAVMMFVNVTHKKLIDETIMTHRMIVEAIGP